MSFACGVCGKTHDDFPGWAHARPDAWLELTTEQRSRGLSNDDLCRTADGHFFVRSVIDLPLIDGPRPTFEIGVWVELAPADFDRYVDTFQDSNQSRIGPMQGRLSNEVKGYPGSHSLPVTLEPQDELQRPFVRFAESAHPLAIAQRDGIGFAKAHAIVYADGTAA